MSILNWFRKPNITINIPDHESASKILMATLALEFETAQEKLKEAKTRVEIAATEHLKSINAYRPSRTMPVTLSFDGLEWICRFANSIDPRNDLVGRGECPEQATYNFDQQWYGSTK